MNKRISELFDYGDEIVSDREAGPFDPARIKEMTMMKIHSGFRGRVLRRGSRSLLIAAVIAGLLTVSAFAAGVGIHRQRQEEIRRQLGIEENHVPEYEETEAPEEAGEGVTVLSVLNTGDTQSLFVNVSPVEPGEVGNDIELTEEDGRVHYLSYSVTWDEENWSDTRVHVRDWDFAGDEQTLIRNPETDYSFSQPTKQAILNKYLEQAYDAGTKTLTLQCFIPNEEIDLSGPVSLHLVCWDVAVELEPVPGEEGVARPADQELRVHRDFGYFSFTPVSAHSSRVYWFAEPVEFENPDLGSKGRFMGVELTPTDMNWIIDCETLSMISTPGKTFADEGERQAYRELELSWLNFVEGLEREAVLRFADGSQIRGLAGETSHFGPEGYLYDTGRYTGVQTVDINTAESVTVCGVTVPLD